MQWMLAAQSYGPIQDPVAGSRWSARAAGIQAREFPAAPSKVSVLPCSILWSPSQLSVSIASTLICCALAPVSAAAVNSCGSRARASNCSAAALAVGLMVVARMLLLDHHSGWLQRQRGRLDTTAPARIQVRFYAGTSNCSRKR